VNRWRYPALAFLTGTAVTVYEFAAPNLFRGYFGQTIYVWANVIGVILGALAIGYFVGGRWADRTTTLGPLGFVLVAAGAYGLLVSWAGPAFCNWLAGPEEYTQDTALQAFIGQSLAASLFLFGPPLIALGMATPLLVERTSATWPVGSAAGIVFAVGTVGSIAGIYLTTFFFIEWWGVRTTLRVAGGVLLAAGAVLFWIESRQRRAGAAGVVAILAFAVPTGAPWDALPPADSKLVLAIESPYQLIRVVDRPDNGGRWLAFDEGMGTYHSMQVDSKTLWTGAYYDAFAHLPEWIGGAGPWRICILGNAAGTMADLLRLHNADARLVIDAIEIDPDVTRAARQAMGLKKHADTRVIHADGRTFLAGCKRGTYDAIVLDAYARQVSIPPALVSREFFELLRGRLTERGMVFVNLGTLRPGSHLVQVVADTMHAGWGGPIIRCPLKDQANILLLAARRSAVPLPPSGSQLDIVNSWAPHQPTGGPILTDDWCPVEALTADDLRLRR